MIKLSNTQETMCHFLSDALFLTKSDYSTFNDWATVYQEMVSQGVAAIPIKLITSVGIPDEIRKSWSTYIAQNISKYHSVMSAQTKLVNLLKENDIQVVILKGSAAAIYYPEQQLRSMGDIDFLVSPDDFEKAYSVLLENGYTLLYPEDHVEYHYTMGKNGCEFELHKVVAGLDFLEKKEEIQKYISDNVKNEDEHKAGRYTVLTLPSVANGLVLLLHLKKHFDNQLGMRQIIDWMMYANSELSDENFHVKYREIYDEFGLTGFAKIMTRMCQLYLGLPESITWCTDADEKVCDWIFEKVLKQGNFGCKIKDEPKKQNLFKLLYQVTVEERPFYQEHKILLPVGLAITLFEYISFKIKNKNKDMGFMRYRLYTKLGIACQF